MNVNEQDTYPDVIDEIKKVLKALQDFSALVTLVTVCEVVIATIPHMKPEIFERRARDGSQFQCSDSFLQHWLHKCMHWLEQ